MFGNKGKCSQNFISENSDRKGFCFVFCSSIYIAKAFLIMKKWCSKKQAVGKKNYSREEF